MTHPLILIATVALLLGCDQKPKTPSPPPVPDIALPETPDAGSPASDGGEQAVAPTSEGDAGPVEMKDPVSPIAVNLVKFVPQVLDGVKARRVEAVRTAPIAHGFYQGPERQVYNVHITGPSQTEDQRRAMYPLLGKDEKEDNGVTEIQGFMYGEFEGQETYDTKKEKSEAVVLVNPFVEVKVSVAPAKAGDARDLLEEIDLEGVSKLR